MMNVNNNEQQQPQNNENNNELSETNLRCNLVVNNDMNCSFSSVMRQVAQMERLIHHSLAWKCCITVNQNAHHLKIGRILMQ